MADKQRDARLTGRREFLRRVSSAGAVAASGLAISGTVRAEDLPGRNTPVGAEPLLPTIKLGSHTITRLVAGWNPIGGHSHTTLNMARVMREYFTAERTTEFLLRCEQQGINAWQYDHTDKGVQALQAARERGSKLKCICVHAERAHDASVEKVLAEVGPIAIVHHGGVTDAMFRAGKQQKIHDFVKKVHDAGVLAGVSSHCPENVKRIADEGWENDLFMTCFHYVTRPREEQQKLMGKVCVGEPFLESDPEDMTAVVRQVDQPCLGYKILAAGRKCWSKYAVEKAFRFAFENLKPIDGVIVGIFPKYYDELAEDARFTRQYGAIA